MRNPSQKRIDIVIFEGFKALEAIGVISVFEYANLHLLQQAKAPGYIINIASTALGSIASDTHMSLEATHVLSVEFHRKRIHLEH